MKVYTPFSLLLLLITNLLNTYGQDPVAITHEMFSVVKSFKTIQFQFESKERMKGMMYNEVTNFKIQIQPYKVYIHQLQPKKGVEGLYVTGEYEGKMKINPNSFPWVTLNLDPQGELMLNNHHHSIFEAGFGYTISIIESLTNKYQSQISKMIEFNGIEKIHGQDCYHLTFTNPYYRLTFYNTGNNETPIRIAQKLKISFYSIVENNPGCKATTVFKPGTRLIVPSDYASKMELYIHKSLMYPVNLKIFDTKGLFEEFTFMNVVINPIFKNIDFLESNPAYRF